jgi:hypothetical protein
MQAFAQAVASAQTVKQRAPCDVQHVINDLKAVNWNVMATYPIQ